MSLRPDLSCMLAWSRNLWLPTTLSRTDPDCPVPLSLCPIRTPHKLSSATEGKPWFVSKNSFLNIVQTTNASSWRLTRIHSPRRDRRSHRTRALWLRKPPVCTICSNSELAVETLIELKFLTILKTRWWDYKWRLYNLNSKSLMLRPGSAIKRKIKPPPQLASQKAQVFPFPQTLICVPGRIEAARR